MTTHKLRGEMATRRVWLDDVELLPERSQAIYNHSPDGFNWGYGGSGPAQLALAIILEITDVRKHYSDYQAFKWAVIAQLPQTDFEVEFDYDQSTGEARIRPCGEDAVLQGPTR